MILVDSSVWIDYFRGSTTPQVDRLDSLLGTEPVAIGDLMLVEVLQGFNDEREFNQAQQLMTALEVIEIAGPEFAIKAPWNFRLLRTRGITVRKTIDTPIATPCIEGGHALLFSDRDFEPFVEHLGLEAA